MKLGLIVFIGAVVLGGFAGLAVLRDPGYVLISYDGAVLETSIWVVALGLVLAYLLVRWTLAALRRLVQGKRRFASWRKRRQTEQALRQTAEGLLLMETRQWQQAGRLLVQSAQASPAPAANYIVAARAAALMGDESGRDALLEAAEGAEPEAPLAVALAQAEALTSRGRWQSALEVLRPLYERFANQPALIEKFLQCHQALGNWSAVLDLVADARRLQALDEAALDALQQEAWLGRIAAADAAAAWEDLPKDQRQNPELVLAVVRRMVDTGDIPGAERLLVHCLDRAWHEGLALYYGTLKSPAPQAQMAAVARWLKARPEDSSLLLTAARVALRNAAWNDARAHLEAGLRLSPTPALQAELGRLLIALGEPKQGAKLLVEASGSLPDLPLPTRAAPGA